MARYTDGTHLIADSRAELHAFAAELGLKRCWFHRDHYDLTGPVCASAALAGGAWLVRPRDVVTLLVETQQRARKRR